MYVTTSSPKAEPGAAAPRKRWRWPRQLGKVVLALVLFVLAVVLSASLYLRISGGNRLDAAVKRIEQSDPHWRWAELLAKRTTPPKTQNSALVVTAAAKLLPERWPPVTAGPADSGPSAFATGRVALDAYLCDRQWVPIALDPRLAAQVTAALAPVQPALAEARKLAELPDGRFPVPEQLDDYFTSRYEAPGLSRRIVSLLWIDAADRAHRGEADAALRSTLALLNAARSLGEEPNLGAQFARMVGVNSAARAAERVLAQTHPPADTLLTLQKHFENELRQPLVVWALRGERAQLFDQMEAVQRGECERFRGIPLERLGRLDAVARDHWLAPLERWLKRGWYFENQARLLEECTRLIELQTDAAAGQRGDLLQQQQRLADEQAGEYHKIQGYRGAFLYFAMPPAFRMADQYRKHQAELGAIIAALAAERYRIAHGRWPESLEALKPAFLAEMPADPFCDGPLRCGPKEDGLVVYSLAEDSADNKGLINRSRAYMHITDRGVRLWNSEHRRQPPPQPMPAGRTP